MAKPKLETGSVLDGFTVGELVYKGGMATLWRVTHPDHTVPMVMKIPLLHEGEDPAAIVSFEMEQMILPRLSGRHVPRFIAAGDFSVQPYIVMEQLSGATLLPRLKELPLPVEEVAALAAKVAMALSDIHRQNVVHLDLKPSNILFRPSGDAVLIDYGLAHHAQLPDLMAEEFRLPYGTAPYMAPEQIMGVRNDSRSDLFALGVLMYFFVTGVRPFGDPQKLKGLKKRIWRDPWPPRKLRPDCPPWMQEIILRCLEVNPLWRYPTAAQLAFDLNNPGQVRLTARSEKLKRDPWLKALQRRFNNDSVVPLKRRQVDAQLAGAPIIMVTIDLDDGADARRKLLRMATQQLLTILPDCRVACVNVLKQNRVALDTTLDADGHSKHVTRLAALRDWAEPMNLPEGKITYHVLEAIDPAKVILDYARSNRVDHIVMGSRARSTMRTWLGSVSGEVAAQAPCTVTVVRSREDAELRADETENETADDRSPAAEV